MRPRIFVGSSSEALSICRAVQSELRDQFDVTVWNQGVFKLTYGALDSLLDVLDSSDAGIFVLTPDDVTVIRGAEKATARANVLLELGMFIGRLGRERSFMITPNDSAVDLPSDLRGLTTADYDPEWMAKEPASAVGPACTMIRAQLPLLRLRVAQESVSRARLDRAMARLSRDLEWLLASQPKRHRSRAPEQPASFSVGRTTVEVTFGRIEDYGSDAPDEVVALPANEYFDDECLKDTNSSLGAFVAAVHGDRFDAFLKALRKQLDGLSVERVPRAERRVDSSYGIGQAILIREPSPSVILVSATTERTGIGLRAEPHFLYAALQGIVEAMNEHRQSTLSMPVLGSGHGGMPVGVALLFNLLALRSILSEDVGRKIRRVNVIVKQGSRSISETMVRDVVGRVASSR